MAYPPSPLAETYSGPAEESADVAQADHCVASAAQRGSGQHARHDRADEGGTPYRVPQGGGVLLTGDKSTATFRVTLVRRHSCMPY